MDLEKIYKNITYKYIKLTLAINDVKSENFLTDIVSFTKLMKKAGIFKDDINNHVREIKNLKQFKHTIWLIETTYSRYKYADVPVRYIFRDKEDALKKLSEIKYDHNETLEVTKREVYAPLDEEDPFYIWTVSLEYILNDTNDIATIIFTNEEDAIDYFLKRIKTNSEYSEYTKENLFKIYAKENSEEERYFISYEILDYSYPEYYYEEIHDSNDFKYDIEEDDYYKRMNITIERFELL